MSKALLALKNGDLTQALDELQDEVRAAPADVEKRVFLFQLLAVMGDWERALKQLNVAREMDAATGVMAQAYQEALNCEALRRDVFSGERTPLIFGEPAAWLAPLLEALRLSSQGAAEAAQQLRQEALGLAPTTSGVIHLRSSDEEAASTSSFEWLADADSRYGPMFEAIINGAYYWVPVHCVQQIALEPPADLRDLVWLPVRFGWTNGGETVGMIPTRYPGSESHSDDLIRLARKTTWEIQSEESAYGFGQRVLATDTDEFPLMNIKTIIFDVATANEGA